MSTWNILAHVEIPSTTASFGFFGGGMDLAISYAAWDASDVPQSWSAASGPIVVTVSSTDSFEAIHIKAAAALRSNFTSPSVVRFIESPGAY